MDKVRFFSVTANEYRNAGKEGERVIHFGGKNSTVVSPGDVFVIMTPGGGGFGQHE